jgi:hypothetical protein
MSTLCADVLVQKVAGSFREGPSYTRPQSCYYLQEVSTRKVHLRASLHAARRSTAGALGSWRWSCSRDAPCSGPRWMTIPRISHFGPRLEGRGAGSTLPTCTRTGYVLCPSSILADSCISTIHPAGRTHITLARPLTI